MYEVPEIDTSEAWEASPLSLQLDAIFNKISYGVASGYWLESKGVSCRIRIEVQDAHLCIYVDGEMDLSGFDWFKWVEGCSLVECNGTWGWGIRIVLNSKPKPSRVIREAQCLAIRNMGLCVEVFCEERTASICYDGVAEIVDVLFGSVVDCLVVDCFSVSENAKHCMLSFGGGKGVVVYVFVEGRFVGTRGPVSSYVEGIVQQGTFFVFTSKVYTSRSSGTWSSHTSLEVEGWLSGLLRHT